MVITTPQKIALFGTSADPPTLAHQKIIYWLAQYYDLVAVWASNNPSKQHQVSLQTRTKMLSLLIEELNYCTSNILLDSTISDRKTYKTIIKAKEVWPNAEFTFIVGSDVVKKIAKWYQIDKILKQVNILIVLRTGHELTNSDLENLQALGTKPNIANLSVPQISSSQYRKTKDSKLLTPTIQKYLQNRSLY